MSYAVEMHLFYTFLLVGARVGGLITSAPVLGNHAVPRKVMAGAAMLLSMALTPLESAHTPLLPQSLVQLVLLVAENGLIGLIIGSFTMFLFGAVSMAGYFMDAQMGLGFVNLIDPFSQQQASIMSAFQFQTALTLYVLLNGPLLLLASLQRSFTAFPANIPLTSMGLHLTLAPMMEMMMSLCLRLALPAFGVLLLTDVGLGLIARMAPQVNVFFLGMPLKIIVGLATIALLMPVLALVAGQIVTGSSAGIHTLLAGGR